MTKITGAARHVRISNPPTHLVRPSPSLVAPLVFPGSADRDWAKGRTPFSSCAPVLHVERHRAAIFLFSSRVLRGSKSREGSTYIHPSAATTRKRRTYTKVPSSTKVGEQCEQSCSGCGGRRASPSTSAATRTRTKRLPGKRVAREEQAAAGHARPGPFAAGVGRGTKMDARGRNWPQLAPGRRYHTPSLHLSPLNPFCSHARVRVGKRTRGHEDKRTRAERQTRGRARDRLEWKAAPGIPAPSPQRTSDRWAGSSHH